jgi:predicted  nucleic acid-binding Zn-ribbon protein
VELVREVGLWVKNAVLNLASLLRDESAPGVVSLGLLFLLLGCFVLFGWTTYRRRSALIWIKQEFRNAFNEGPYEAAVVALGAALRNVRDRGAYKPVVTAWKEYSDTLVRHAQDGHVVLRNAVRPSAFFNLDDLHFSPGFWRIVPGLFVTTGLFLTFLGLISALNSMAAPAGTGSADVNIDINGLLTIASAKFIMSLTGLLCSIVFTIVLRVGTGRIDQAIHDLCGAIERRLTFISLEELAVEQLATTREQREHFRTIGLELVAELGRPLREELPAHISKSIGEAMSPLLQQVGQIGATGMEGMVRDLSSRFSDDVGRALSQASDKLMIAGERISELSARMDQSSGRMGSEMDNAVVRLAQTVDDLRAAMGATAQTASTALTQGAEQLLSVMNETLKGIRDNTGEGAHAISSAALEMRQAAEAFRAELEEATKTGSGAAREQMQAASQAASNAIDGAGISILDAFDKRAGDIAKATEAFSSKTASDLLDPLGQISERLKTVVAELNGGMSSLGRFSDGIRAGAEATEQAAGQFRGASSAFVEAATPLRASTSSIEVAIKNLAEATANISDTVGKSAAATASSAASALASAQQILGSEAKAIEASLSGIEVMLEKLRGQGDRLDDIDEKLGKAFEAYRTQVASAVEGMFGHVKEMQAQLSPALDTLHSIVEQAEQFAPESRRR